MYNTFVQMEILYNTMYEVNVEANNTHIYCGNTSTIITLSYGEHKESLLFCSLILLLECDSILHHSVKLIIFFSTITLIAKCNHPFDESEENFFEGPFINGYYTPMVEGSSIILSCPLGYYLNGSNISTCMGNGEWEPDPREAVCKRKGIKLMLSSG